MYVCKGAWIIIILYVLNWSVEKCSVTHINLLFLGIFAGPLISTVSSSGHQTLDDRFMLNLGIVLTNNKFDTRFEEI